MKSPDRPPSDPEAQRLAELAAQALFTGDQASRNLSHCTGGQLVADAPK
jgi:hypothetical protein